MFRRKGKHTKMEKPKIKSTIGDEKKLNELTDRKDQFKDEKPFLRAMAGGVTSSAIVSLGMTSVGQGIAAGTAAVLGLATLANPIGVVFGAAIAGGVAVYKLTNFTPASTKYKQKQFKTFKSIATFFEKHKTGKFVLNNEKKDVRVIFNKSGKGPYKLDQYPLGNEIHYAVMYKEDGKEKPLFQWRKTKKGNKIVLFMFQKAIIYMGDDSDKFGKSDTDSYWNFPEPIKFDGKQIILPISIDKYPQMEMDSFAIQKRLQEAVEKFKAAGKGAKNTKKLSKIKRGYKKVKQRNEVRKARKILKEKYSAPAFDPFPFATQIKQKDHKIYKNLRY